MELVAVDSSNVFSVGYDPETRLLRVCFKDLSTYDYPDTPPEIHSALMSAKNKGAFIARYLGKNGVKTGASTPSTAKHAATSSSTLQTYEPDECCGRLLSKSLQSGMLDTIKVWACPKCGCEWTAEPVGDVWHWSPVPMIAILRV